MIHLSFKKFKLFPSVAIQMIIVLSLFATPLFSVVVEKILAKIEKDIFTLSDLKIARAFQLVEIVFEDQKQLNDMEYIEKIIDSKLIYSEGMILKVINVTDKEVQEKIDQIKILKGENFNESLEKFEISEFFLRKLIREQLYAKKYFVLRRDFFLGFGDEEGKKKMNQWLLRLRNKSSVQILNGVN